MTSQQRPAMKGWRQAGASGLLAGVCVALVCAGLAADEAAPAVPPKTDVHKLVIVRAEYGDLPDGMKVDVTPMVAGMVKQDELSVDATNENFTDPSFGVFKKLRVDYTFNGTKKSKTVDENQTLTISSTGE